MRKNRTWIATLAAVTALALASTAVAAPPDGKGPPDRDDGGIEGMTCAQYFEDPEYQGDRVMLVDGATVDGFQLTLTESSPCIDIVNVEAGLWKVSVEMGNAREVQVRLRSSVPGDWCWVETTKVDRTDLTDPGAYMLDSPKSEPNACAPPFGQGGAGGDSINDANPALAFDVMVSRGKKLADPVVITVDFP